MKKWIWQPALAIVLTSVALTSCKKDKDNEKTNTEKIAAAPWKYDKAEAVVDRDGTGDFPVPDSQVEICERDNTITFAANGSGTIDEGAIKCDPGDPQSMPFSWSFKDGEKIISFPTAIVTGVDGDVKVISISETSMVLSKDLPNPGIPGLPATLGFILTLKH
jgi:hypothetical protein